MAVRLLATRLPLFRFSRSISLLPVPQNPNLYFTKCSSLEKDIQKNYEKSVTFSENVFSPAAVHNARLVSEERKHTLQNLTKRSREMLHLRVLNSRRNSSQGFTGIIGKEAQIEINVDVTKGINSILEFWFGSWARSDFEGQVEPEDQLALSKIWFGGGPDLDTTIRNRYFVLIEKAGKGELEEWEETPRGALALVLLLDQFTRNAFRDSGKAFERDDLALAIAKRAIEKGLDKKVLGPMRLFFYMPFEHSEDLEDQKLAVHYFEKTLSEISPELKPFCEHMVEYAERHLTVVQKFGRFPHRNVLLGRESTPEEIEYLKEGKWF